MEKKEHWEFVKESGGKCIMCFYESCGKCTKKVRNGVENPTADELCKDYKNAYLFTKSFFTR
jgi:hypothetical protein